jgi:ketosteroid isomerase-like protein
VSSANVDLARSIFADWARGDFRSVSWADPELEFVTGDGPDPGSWVGLPAVAERWREQMSGWDALRLVGEEFRALDDERVLVLFRRSGLGKASGLDVAQIGPTGAAVLHIRGGSVTRIVEYLERDSAFADLGLARSDASGPPGPAS